MAWLQHSQALMWSSRRQKPVKGHVIQHCDLLLQATESLIKLSRNIVWRSDMARGCGCEGVFMLGGECESQARTCVRLSHVCLHRPPEDRHRRAIVLSDSIGRTALYSSGFHRGIQALIYCKHTRQEHSVSWHILYISPLDRTPTGSTYLMMSSGTFTVWVHLHILSAELKKLHPPFHKWRP